MSVAASTWAWKLDLPSTEKLVALALADHANDEDFTCWPSLTHLEKKTGLNRTTVWRAIDRLVELNLIKRVGNKPSGSTIYLVQVGAQITQVHSAPRCVAQRGRCADHLGVGAQRTSNHKYNHQEPSEINKPPLPPKGGKASKAVALQTFLANCKQQSVKPIPETDPVFAYAKQVNIPIEFLHLCWREFVERHTDSGKRYTDWRKAFRNCVRGNWYKLWYADPGGGIALSSQGRIAQTKHEAA